MGQAQPRDFGMLAPLVVEYSARGDAVACELMHGAATHIDGLASRLAALGVARLALSGGLTASMEPWLSPQTRERLVMPEGDALSGALQLARIEAEAAAQSQRAAQTR
jgi:glucosamine kinase